MKVTINRAEFLAAARRAANIAPSASPLDVLRGVLLETDGGARDLTMTATNMEVSLELKVPCASLDDDAMVINAQLLEEMLERLDGDTVDFQRDAGASRVTIQSGMACYQIPVMDRGAFPKVEIPFPEDTVKVSGIPSMAKRTLFAVGQNNEQPLLRCVNLMFTHDGLRAVGSNGTCIVSAKGDDSSTGNINLLVPALSLVKLARMCGDKDEFRVGTTGQCVVFLRENFMYSARLMNGSYINTEQVIGSLTNNFTVLTDVLDLRKSLDAVISVASEGKVRLTFRGGQIEFYCMDSIGNANTLLEVIPLTGTPQGEYWYQPQQFSACLQALTGTVTLGIAQGGMLTLATENAFYMQTGVRPQAAVAEGPRRTAA